MIINDITYKQVAVSKCCLGSITIFEQCLKMKTRYWINSISLDDSDQIRMELESFQAH